MDDLRYLRERIPAYADYGDEDARHLVDKQVRAYVGEALSGLRERLGSLPGPTLADRLDGVILRCEFTNQQFVHVMDRVRLSSDELEHLHVVDHELVLAADRSGTIGVEALAPYLDELESLFARRLTAVVHPVA